jgi:hypothetical protein
MPRIILDRIRLPLTSRVNQLRHDQPVVADAVRLRHGKRVALHGLDGAPHVNNLDAVLEEFIRGVGQVVRDAGLCGGVGLVDVDALDGAAELAVRRDAFLVGGLAADSMVEDVDTRGAGAGRGWLAASMASFGCFRGDDTG